MAPALLELLLDLLLDVPLDLLELLLDHYTQLGIYFGAFAAYTPPFAAILVPFESASNSLSIDTTLAR